MTNKTFIVGADQNYQGFLPWWVENVRKHDKETHITIADFGLSKEARKWVNNNADHILEYPKTKRCSWFHKPQTLYDAPYTYKCWIDIDCEVTQNISEIFDFVEDEKIALTEDPCRRKEIAGEEWLATGVIVLKDKPQILEHWTERCKETKWRGDQEVLHDILKKDEWRKLINVMPLNYQWLRLLLARGKDHPDKKIVHWTGPAGKEIILQKIRKR